MTATITCPRCGSKSGHPQDLQHGYCGNCHDFTSNAKTAQLIARLVELGVPAQWYDERGQGVKIDLPQALITIEPRLPYCDRGRWIAKTFPRGRFGRDFDEQDGWPRYYYTIEACAIEVEEWIACRRLAEP